MQSLLRPRQPGYSILTCQLAKASVDPAIDTRKGTSWKSQVGYWLWEPATGTVIQTLAIPRGQTAMAVGRANADAKSFRLEAVRGSTTNGISSNPFLEYAFRTESYTVTITIHDNGTWSYQQQTVLVILGQTEPFLHTDYNTLMKIGEPTPNPTAQKV